MSITSDNTLDKHVESCYRGSHLSIATDFIMVADIMQETQHTGGAVDVLTFEVSTYRGPLGKNRTFWYISYEILPIAVITTVRFLIKKISQLCMYVLNFVCARKK